MSRPSVSVVVPFAGDQAAASQALSLLRDLQVGPGDERILADNSVTVAGAPDGVTVVPAPGERSPGHARNAGAGRAGADWILFLDADTHAPAHLLDAYFEAGEPAADVGALVGEVRPAPGAGTLAARYASQRNFLSARAHLAHPFRPRAAAANLMVRRAAFEQAQGFAEGVLAAEDTDLCWRLQDLGWRLELREQAAVEHEYRASVRELARQWRSYAAGRAWLARRYPGFRPEPAAVRGVRRAFALINASRRGGPARGLSARAPGTGAPPLSVRERIEFLALDILLAVQELIGLRMSNDAQER
jgi:hypothetical protein